MARVRIGISGFSYPPWRGVFYPAGVAHKNELAYASARFPSIEINGSFYNLLRPASVERWYEVTPADFVFSIKGSRFITHMKRLADVRAPLANFFGSGLLALREKLGPILWQLPPSMSFDEERLASFFSMLPRTTTDAARFARAHHDARIDGRSSFVTASSQPIRHAIEPRHASFESAACKRLLRNHDIALCVADTAGVFPVFDAVTSDFVYVRLHGDTKLYESGYSRAALERWAVRVKAWKRARDVYVYFDNDARVRAPFDALALDALVTGKRARARPRNLARAGEPARTEWPGWSGAKRERPSA